MRAVGEQIRDLRKARGLTIQALADGVGKSVGYVSQIERDISVVDIATLDEIAQVLGVGINWFFHGDADAPPGEQGLIVRRHARRKLEFTGSGVTEELLSPSLSGAFEMVLGTFAPGATTGQTRHPRPGEEGGLVLSGRIDLEFDGQAHRLEAGDSFTFPIDAPHKVGNPSETDQAVVIWIIAPPTY